MPFRIDGQVAMAKGRRVEWHASEMVRLAVLIQPSRQPLHFQGQGELVHGAFRFAGDVARHLASPTSGAEAATPR